MCVCVRHLHESLCVECQKEVGALLLVPRRAFIMDDCAHDEKNELEKVWR